MTYKDINMWEECREFEARKRETYRRMETEKEWDKWVAKVETGEAGIELPVKYYVYSPKIDITVYELALIVPVFHTKINIERVIELLPPEAKRHFKEVDKWQR